MLDDCDAEYEKWKKRWDDEIKEFEEMTRESKRSYRALKKLSKRLETGRVSVDELPEVQPDGFVPYYNLDLCENIITSAEQQLIEYVATLDHAGLEAFRLDYNTNAQVDRSYASSSFGRVSRKAYLRRAQELRNAPPPPVKPWSIMQVVSTALMFNGFYRFLSGKGLN